MFTVMCVLALAVGTVAYATAVCILIHMVRICIITDEELKRRYDEVYGKHNRTVI